MSENRANIQPNIQTTTATSGGLQPLLHFSRPEVLMSTLDATLACIRDIRQSEWRQLGTSIVEGVIRFCEENRRDPEIFLQTQQTSSCHLLLFVMAMDSLLMTTLYFASSGGMVTCTTSGDTEEEIVWRRFKFTRLNLSETKRILIEHTSLCTHCKANTESTMFSSARTLLDTLIQTLAQNEPNQPEESLNFGEIPIASKQSHCRVPLATARANPSLNREPEAYHFQSSYPVNDGILRDDSLQDDHGLQRDQVIYLGMLVDRELSLCPFKPGKEQRNHRIDTDLVNIFPKLYDLRSCQEDITRAVRIMACWMAKNPHDKRDISSNPWYTLLKPGIQI